MKNQRGKHAGKYSKSNNSQKSGLITLLLCILLVLVVILCILLASKTNKKATAETVNEPLATEWIADEPTETKIDSVPVETTATMITAPTTPIEIIIETEAPTELPDPFAEYDVGDYFKFGSYEQDNNTGNGTETIEWLILEKQADKMLLVSRYALDSRKFNSKAAAVTWEDSSIRTWLNRAFYNIAFSGEEQAYILTTTVSADKNPKFKTKAGSDTQDKIFLLSVIETEKYLSDKEARFCKPTAYAKAQDTYVNSSSGGCWWLMRTPGDTSKKVASSNTDGTIDYNGGRVESDKGGVRPAMWINTATSWTHNEKEQPALEKTSEYILPFSSERLLTEADISFLSKEELKIARNEIFARYGRLFEDEQLQAYFDAKEWYSGHIASADFSQAMLSSIEEANVKFIKSHEQPEKTTTEPIDAQTLKKMAYGETTVKQLRQHGFELTFESHLDDGLADIYRIKNTNVLVALGRNAYGIVDEEVVVAVSAPANLVIPDRIGSSNDAFEESNIIFVPDGKIGGDVGTGLFFGIPEEIPNRKITKDTNVCFTGTNPPASSYSWLYEFYIVDPHGDPVPPEIIETPDTKLQDWQNAYLEYLKDWDFPGFTFELAFVDEDTIPELYINTHIGAGGGSVCAYKGGQVVAVDLQWEGSAAYIPRSGLIYNCNGHMGYYTTEVHRLNNAGFVSLFSGLREEYYTVDENKEEQFIVEYSIGNRVVSEDEFNEAVTELFNFSESMGFERDGESYAEITQRILDWNNANISG